MHFIKNFAATISFLLIVALGAFLYFYKLDEIPNGLYVDEAVSGYNAYSVLKTGKDEYGKPFPLAFRFFGSYSPPMHTYLTVPIIYFRGLKISSPRVISGISGLVLVIAVFFFIKSLKIIRSPLTPFLGAFLFAISPWLIFYSRAGYEMNIGFALFSLGVLYLWLGLKKPKLLLLGFPILSLSSYGAHTERFLVPIIAVLFLLVFKKVLFLSKKYLSSSLLLAFLIQLPNIYFLSTPAFFTKSTLFYKGAIFSQAEKIANFLPTFIGVPLAFIREFTSQYLSYFSPRSLFFLGDPDLQRSIPELSVFYFWMVIPYLYGIYRLFKSIKTDETKFISLLTLVIPIFPALSGDPFSSQRALPLLLPLSLIIFLGIDGLIYNRKIVYWSLTFLVFSVFSLLLLWRSYFVLFPKERAKIWGYGFSPLAEEIRKRPNEKFVIDQSRTKPAYIELAYFLEYPPEELQRSVDPKVRENYYSMVDFKQEYRFANMEIRNIEWKTDIYKEQILVGDELAVSESQQKEHFLTEVFEIRDPIGFIVFVGYKTNPARKCAATGNFSLYCKNQR